MTRRRICERNDSGECTSILTSGDGLLQGVEPIIIMTSILRFSNPGSLGYSKKPLMSDFLTVFRQPHPFQQTITKLELMGTDDRHARADLSENFTIEGCPALPCPVVYSLA